MEIKVNLKINPFINTKELSNDLFKEVPNGVFNKQEFEKQFLNLMKEKGEGKLCRIPMTHEGKKIIEDIIQEALKKSMIIQINNHMEQDDE